jgi:hypothetical protein
MESLCGKAGGAGAAVGAARAAMGNLCAAFNRHNPPPSDLLAKRLLGAIGESTESDLVGGTEDDEGVPSTHAAPGIKGADREQRAVTGLSRVFPAVWEEKRLALDLVIVSSLTRAVQTAMLALGAPAPNSATAPPFLASDDVRERVSFYSCDGRRTRGELEYDFPALDWDEVPDGSDSMFRKKETQHDECVACGSARARRIAGSRRALRSSRAFPKPSPLAHTRRARTHHTGARVSGVLCVSSSASQRCRRSLPQSRSSRTRTFFATS